MNLLSSIKNSIYNPTYYHELLKKPLSYSLKYYFSLITIISAIFTIFSIFSFIPQTKLSIEHFLEDANKYYPEELEIKIKRGELSTNVQEPYFIETPTELNSDDYSSKNIVAIDTKNEPSVELLKSYDTTILITKNAVMFSKNDGDATIKSLQEMPNFVLNKAVFTSYSAKIESLMKFFYPISIIVVFFINIVLLSFRLIYLFLASLLILLFVRLKKVDITYTKSYQIGIHAMTLGALLFTLLDITDSNIQIPFLFTIILVVIVIINIKKQQSIGIITDTNNRK